MSYQKFKLDFVTNGASPVKLCRSTCFFEFYFSKLSHQALTVVESVDIFWPLSAYQNSFCLNQGDNFSPQWSDSMIATGGWSYSIIAIEWANPKQIRICKIKVMIVLVIYDINGLVFASSSSWGDLCSIYGAVSFWCTCLVNMSGLVKLQGAVSIGMTLYPHSNVLCMWEFL